MYENAHEILETKEILWELCMNKVGFFCNLPGEMVNQGMGKWKLGKTGRYIHP